MKRIALLLAALLMFSLTGCGSSEAAGKASDSDKAGAYEVIPPEDGRGDLIPASSDVVSIPVLVGGGLPFTSMENLMNENYEDGTYTYEDMTQEDVREYAIPRIARFKVPKFVFFVDEFPMNPANKIQKFKLRDMAKELTGRTDQEVFDEE